MAAPTEDLDDLDAYLDDVLDDFSKPLPTTIPPSSTSAKSDATPGEAATTAAAEDDEGVLEEEFAKQLAAGMEQLLKEFGGAEGALPDDAEFKQTMDQFVNTMRELQNNTEGQSPVEAPSSQSTGEGSSSAAPGGGSFQDKILNTVNKLQDSSEKVEAQVTEDLKSGGGIDDTMMENMMKELEGLMSSPDFDNLFSGMMEQLVSKDLLYEPMKDLAEKYPLWLEENKASLKPEDYERYKKQHEIVREIVVIYDRSNNSDLTDADNKKVVDLMQQMQDCGNPPEAILKELAPGMEIGADGMPTLPPNMAGQDCIVM
ncbi:Peroxisome chaperone and import receptor [Quaeritorhiza haematococci]|nr:Peroxisome chaperone and import receptor [Quaeritorhiza haematococci]